MNLLYNVVEDTMAVYSKFAPDTWTLSNKVGTIASFDQYTGDYSPGSIDGKYIRISATEVWYINDYTGTKTTYTLYKRGTAITVKEQGTTSYGEVSSTTRNAYPDNNYSGSYWYVYDRSETSKVQGDFVEDVVHYKADAFPENGLHTDGYWYVKEAA